jgi:hypothetical protein
MLGQELLQVKGTAGPIFNLKLFTMSAGKLTRYLAQDIFLIGFLINSSSSKKHLNLFKLAFRMLILGISLHSRHINIIKFSLARGIA